jgi:hypothetical protein
MLGTRYPHLFNVNIVHEKVVNEGRNPKRPLNHGMEGARDKHHYSLLPSSPVSLLYHKQFILSVCCGASPVACPFAGH